MLEDDISTAHSSMFERHMTYERSDKKRTAFHFKKELLLSEMPVTVIKLATRLTYL